MNTPSHIDQANPNGKSLQELRKAIQVLGNDAEQEVKITLNDCQTTFSLSPTTLESLYNMLAAEAEGREVSIIELPEELTTQQAANYLNVSRPFVVKLLEGGEIPFRKVGTHRRVKMKDVLAYEKQHEENTKGMIAELGKLSQELENWE